MSNFVRLSDGRFVNMDQVAYMDVEGTRDAVPYIAIYFPCYSDTLGDQACITVNFPSVEIATQELERLVAASKGGVNQ